MTKISPWLSICLISAMLGAGCVGKSPPTNVHDESLHLNGSFSQGDNVVRVRAVSPASACTFNATWGQEPLETGVLFAWLTEEAEEVTGAEVVTYNGFVSIPAGGIDTRESDPIGGGSTAIGFDFELDAGENLVFMAEALKGGSWTASCARGELRVAGIGHEVQFVALDQFEGPVLVDSGRTPIGQKAAASVATLEFTMEHARAALWYSSMGSGLTPLRVTTPTGMHDIGTHTFEAFIPSTGGKWSFEYNSARNTGYFIGAVYGYDPL